MHRGLWNTDHASFFSEATLIEIGVYFGRRFVYTVSNIVGNTNTKKNNKNNKITSEVRDLYQHPYDLMPQYPS